MHRDMNSANVSQFAAVSHPYQHLLPKGVQQQSTMSHPKGGKEVLMDAEANGKTMLSSMVVHRDINSANVSQFAAVSHPSQHLLPKGVQQQSTMSHPKGGKGGTDGCRSKWRDNVIQYGRP